MRRPWPQAWPNASSTEFAHTLALGTPDGSKPVDTLTERQQEILGMVAEGLTYKEIAAALFLSEKTIKYHMGRIQEHCSRWKAAPRPLPFIINRRSAVQPPTYPYIQKV